MKALVVASKEVAAHKTKERQTKRNNEDEYSILISSANCVCIRQSDQIPLFIGNFNEHITVEGNK